ncbi:hypothetical protein [Meiothermus rufus]|uniref:hypothetical protein n=1 Tax=Meiothermus rufus TaxID=604332 RepID=UPI0012EB6386|nr:hypothetical protein [Meiothermus rufus]
MHYQLLAYQLPAGPWIENSPTLWDAMRIFGPEVAAVNLQKALRLQAKLQSLGVQVQGIIDLETAKWLVAFKESPADAPEPDSRVPPEYRIEYHMHRLEQGNCGSAAIIARTKRKDLKDPFGALSFVRTWKDRIGETCRPALLNVGIGAISDIWNGYHSDDKGLLQEALEFGKEALRIEKNPYTYCALQSIYRALDQDEEADRCIQLAEARGKPCQQNRHGIRRIYDTGNQGGHSPDERDELPF